MDTRVELQIPPSPRNNLITPSGGGLGETEAFNKLDDSKKNYIGQINNEYKYGIKGTKCN